MPKVEQRKILAATAAEAGGRLDLFLVHRLPELSRSRVQALIRSGHLLQDGSVVRDSGHRVAAGSRYQLTIPAPEPAVPAAEPLPLAVVYEDDQLIVVDKAKGVAVHPGPGHASGTLVNALIAHCGASLSGIGGVKRPGIVHRLDKDTTGLLVVAKTDRAHTDLARQFAAHGTDGRLERKYLGLAWSSPRRTSGSINVPLGRSNANRTKMAVVSAEAGRRAVTHYRVVSTFSGSDGKPLASLLELSLETGRTHQIRVHLAHIGHPLLGDTTYGAGFKASIGKLPSAAQAALAAMGRQALHAAELSFLHPTRGKRLRFSSPVPSDMAELAAALTPEGARR